MNTNEENNDSWGDENWVTSLMLENMQLREELQIMQKKNTTPCTGMNRVVLQGWTIDPIRYKDGTIVQDLLLYKELANLENALPKDFSGPKYYRHIVIEDCMIITAEAANV